MKKRNTIRNKKPLKNAIRKNRKKDKLQRIESNMKLQDLAENDDVQEDTIYVSDYNERSDTLIRLWFTTNPCGIGFGHRASKSHASFIFLKN